MSLCADCFKGVRHEGTPEGTFQTIGGINSYVAVPTGDYPKDKVILYIADAFGLKLENNLLLVDDFARNGYKVVAPDVFEGDPAPVTAFEPGSTFNFSEWIVRHAPSIGNAIILKVIAALKAEGVTRFGATGYCYGGRTNFDLAFTGDVHVVAVSHPSLLKTPDDLHKYFELAKAPLLINSCEVDQQFPIESQKIADEIFGDGKFAPGYLRTYWPGCVHGFAVRGDLSKPEVKAGKEGSFKASVEWFQKYL